MPQAATRLTKRRHEPEEEDRDERMDRSPTPERPKRAAPKRARTTPSAVIPLGKGLETAKENKPPTVNDESDVDVGFLLGTSFLLSRYKLALTFVFQRVYLRSPYCR